MSEQDDIRALASELNKPTLLFDPSDVRKGVVVSIQSGPPPSVTVRMSGSMVEVPGVVYLRGYRPEVSDTVLMIKVSGSIVIWDSYARTYPESETFQHLAVMDSVTVFKSIPLDSGWTSLTLVNGWTGDLKVKRLVDGTVIWRGSATGAGPAGVLVTTLPVGFRPVQEFEAPVSRPGSYGTSKVTFSAAGGVGYWADDGIWTFIASGALTFSVA